MSVKETRSAIVLAVESYTSSVLDGRTAFPREMACGNEELLPYTASPAALKILLSAKTPEQIDAYFNNLPIEQIVAELNNENSPRWVKMSRVAALGAYKAWADKKAITEPMTKEIQRNVKAIKHNDEFAFNAGKNVLAECYKNLAA